MKEKKKNLKKDSLPKEKGRPKKTRVSGKDPSVRINVNDITGRNKAGELSREGIDYRILIETANEGIWLLDKSAKTTYVNKTMAEMIGYTTEEMLGRSLYDFMDTVARIEAEKYFERRKKGIKEIHEFRFLKKDGSDLWTIISTNPLIDDQGQFSGALGMITDITGRKKAEEELLKHKEFIEDLIESMQDGFSVLDANGRRIMANKAFYRITGFSKEELINIGPPFPFWPPEHINDIKMAFDGMRRGELKDFDLTFMRKNGERFPVIINTSCLRNEQGEVANYLIILKDITARKKAEEEKLELERKLLHSQKLESLGILAGGIAHDFNNLLMAILGNLDIAAMKISPLSTAKTYIDAAIRASKKASELTNQMLAYSGRGLFVIKNIDLSQVIEENIHLLKASIPKTISLKLFLEKNISCIKADAMQIQQVVMNLIINASEAIGQHSGVISISTIVMECSQDFLNLSRILEKPEPGKFVCMEITDTGCGMDLEMQQRLFDPFFTTKFTGRGLGMSAVLGIIKGHKGAIMVESEVGKGTTLRVLFPVSEDSKEDQAKADSIGALKAQKTEAYLLTGTVLVVDDEEMVRDVSLAILTGLGLNVISAADGEKAISIFKDNADKIDVVLMDLTMPGMDGIASFMEMKRIKPDVKVILSSGYGEQELTQRKAEGFADFIQKPYVIQNLKEKLETLLKKQ